MSPAAAVSTATNGSEEDQEAQYVFLMLLDEQGKRLLMLEQDSEWYLPYFEYPYMSAENKANACIQLQNKLGIDESRPYFTALFDPAGFVWTDTMHGKQTRGYSHLVFVESHCPHLKPEPLAAWHDVDSVMLISENSNRSCGPNPDVHDFLFGIMHQFLAGTYPSTYLNDVRYRPGWFQSASQYLKSLLAEIGVETTKPVFQHSLSSNATLLKVDSDHGRYFLKAPAAGSNEVLITTAIVQHLPSYTLRVVGTNADLNCFVSESFEDLTDEGSDLPTQTEMIDKLAQLHFDSLHCLDGLKEHGVPDRSPVAFIKQIDKWLDNDTSLKDLLELRFQEFSDNAEMIKQGLIDLDECGLPLTLVHGDAHEPNFAYKLNEAGISPVVTERYLQKCSDYASMKKLRKAFKVACIIGWMGKVWCAVDCLAACEPEKLSVLLEFVHKSVSIVMYGLQDMAEQEPRAAVQVER